MDICKDLLLIVSMAIVTSSCILGGIYYHESINKSIFAEYGISSQITFYIPYTVKTNDYWWGYPNQSSYDFASTNYNITQFDNLQKSNPYAFNSMSQKIFYNENLTNQNNGTFYDMVPAYAWDFICLYLIYEDGKR